VCPASRVLNSDSSTWAWGGVDSTGGGIIQEFWRTDHTLHINTKELIAAAQTIKAFAKTGEHILLNIDNQVALSYLKKWGGKKIYLNQVVKDLLDHCIQHKIQLQVQWVPSQQQVADQLTRWRKDPGDYTLEMETFQKIIKFFQKYIQPEVDMFCSPGNKKIPKACTRWPHWGSFLVDALNCDLSQVGQVYTNPPWKIIYQWLCRLMLNKNITSLKKIRHKMRSIFG